MISVIAHQRWRAAICSVAFYIVNRILLVLILTYQSTSLHSSWAIKRRIISSETKGKVMITLGCVWRLRCWDIWKRIFVFFINTIAEKVKKLAMKVYKWGKSTTMTGVTICTSRTRETLAFCFRTFFSSLHPHEKKVIALLISPV